MGLNDLIYWYQKKIGTYDKQQWEKTVEQRIFCGLRHVPMRQAKLKTEFIDVDLVRGSSFPKAKPKHGLSIVAYLALQRLLLLPFYGRWWIQQTSPRIFAFFLLLYCLQLFNTYAYFFRESHGKNKNEIVSSSEILIPVVMMFTLCMVHSQIVSTNSGPVISTKSNRQRTRRSRHGRSRFNKAARPRSSLEINDDCKNSHGSVSDKASGIDMEIAASVRFAKNVVVGTTAVSSSVNLGQECNVILPANESRRESLSKAQPSSVANSSIDVEESVDDLQDNEEALDTVHQDDDGFESLNGNVSSDNDREAGSSQKRKKSTDTDPISEKESQFEDSRAINTLFIGPAVTETLRKVEDCDESEEDERHSPGSEFHLAYPREDRKQCESEEEGECEEATVNHLTEATTSATEWMGVTTNSDECSYSSELEESDVHSESNMNCEFVEHPFSWEFEMPPSILLSSSCTSSDRVSCTIWTRRDIKKAELSVLDISSAIISRVESMPESMDYFYVGLVLSIVLSLVPSLRRLNDHFNTESTNCTMTSLIPRDFRRIHTESLSHIIARMMDVAFGATFWERTMILISAFERLVLASLLFFLLAVAERTYKQRLLYAKLFSHLTSSRRARKSDLPHFRLNKVRNIKTWLSVRSYLKRRGPQRSVDVIVSSIFIITLALLSFVCLELIKDLDSLHSRYNIEALFWSFALGMFILRFMTLGTKINKKYRNLSVLITEQINLYLQIEQKPHKKEELMVANSVLKLAADLIKELESPFKISGLSANPYLYTITKVVLLSALSGVLSELLGFKLKLHKIKIK